MIWTAEFWKATAERAIKTVAQALLSMWLVGDVTGLLEVDWVQVLSIAGGAGLASVLSSLVGASLVGPPGSPSWVVDRNAA